MLQWVHGLLTVGDSHVRPLAKRQNRLQWVHGLLTVGDIPLLREPSPYVCPASMGPRPSDRGRPTPPSRLG